jgi:cellulose biosynthesis protein BcsQ
MGRDLYSLIQRTEAPGVCIIPSSSCLLETERALAAEVGAETILRSKVAQLHDTLKQEGNIVPLDTYYGELERSKTNFGSEDEAVANYLKRIPELQRERGPFDYVLFDCPPGLGVLAVNALATANAALIPVEAHAMAFDGLVQSIQTVNAIKERLHPALCIAGILACRVDGRTRHALEVVEQLRRRFPKLVYQTVIRENVRLSECPSFGVPVTQYDPHGNGTKDYRALAEEIINRKT